MSLKDTQQYQQLKEAMNLIEEMKIPDHLQPQALAHLLTGHSNSTPSVRPTQSALSTSSVPVSGEFREYVSAIKPKGATQEIPCFIYWAKSNEEKQEFNERDVVELYRRAGARPPKNVGQALRDLASRKYMRLESVKGQPGYVRLSRIGEDFVLHDLNRASD